MFYIYIYTVLIQLPQVLHFILVCTCLRLQEKNFYIGFQMIHISKYFSFLSFNWTYTWRGAFIWVLHFNVFCFNITGNYKIYKCNKIHHNCIRAAIHGIYLCNANSLIEQYNDDN